MDIEFTLNLIPTGLEISFSRDGELIAKNTFTNTDELVKFAKDIVKQFTKEELDESRPS